jgi:hypothetical protein
MKTVFILISGLVLLFCLSCSRNSDKQDFYGTYTFEEVSCLSPLSSSTIDYMNERMTGTKYTIEADLFKIETADNTVEISTPSYIKEEIQNDLSILSDVNTSIGDEVKYQYTIYKKDGNKTNLRLYVSSDNMCIGSYVDNTANGSEIIMYIFKLSK